MKELALLFLRLGFTAFGGPAAHIAMMELEVVRKRKWLTHQEFLDLLGACNLIPGPTSTELAIHIGHRRGGWPGLLVAGTCFIVPAVLLVSAISWAYVTWGTLPDAEALLRGVKPVVLAIVADALYRLSRTALKELWFWGIAAAVTAAALLGVHELALLFGCGALFAAIRAARGGPAAAAAMVAGIAGRLRPRHAAAASLVAAPAAAASAVSLPSLFLVFLKIGSVLFGSGYVLLAFLRADLVERLGWLTEKQLLDAVAVGQITPGPVFTTATFVGWVLAGPRGAAVATLGIFLPAFVFVALSGPIIPRIRTSRIAGAFLDGVNVASLALMAAVTVHLARTAIVDVPTVLLAIVSLVILTRRLQASLPLLLLGATTTWLLHH